MSKQKLSLQEQLLKSGLISTAKAKSVKSDKRKQEHLQRNNNVVIVDEAKELAKKAHAEQVERDRELNQLKQQQDEQKHVVAQIKQLIEMNKLPKDAEGVAYRFDDNHKVKTIYVTESMREHIIRGRLAVVKWDESYEVVAAEVAKKISLRDPTYVLVDNETVVDVETATKADDPYAAFEIPDDLMW